MVVGIEPASPAELAGVCVGDEIVSINGQPLTDVIQYRVLTDESEVLLTLMRSGLELDIDVVKPEGASLGIEVHSAVFDRVRTCDNHCEFCFIYQLPKGLRRSLYLKDDDYRLSFLYGNFTTLTRFTEADLERVITQGLSPLYVSIHATDPEVRADMLKNRRGAMSLRWLRALLDHGIEVHGQIVVCPGVNDGAILDDTLCGILDEYHELANVAVVPLGLSKFNAEPRMRLHTLAEANAVVDTIERWQAIFLDTLGHRMVWASDEYYLIAGRTLPDAEVFGDFSMHEDGIGMSRAFELEFLGDTDTPIGVQPGFFSWVDGAPAEGYRAPRTAGMEVPVGMSRRQPIALSTRRRGTAVLTGDYGAQVLTPLIHRLGRDDVRVLRVENRFFGGNTAVAGLMVGEDIARVLSNEPIGDRYLVPDVCLSGGRFLDGLTPADLPRAIEIISTDGVALRKALQ